MGAGELGNLAGGAADTAADVEDLHALLDTHAVGEVVLVAGNGLVERLARGEAAEVEGLAPAILVQVGRQVVVAGTVRPRSSTGSRERLTVSSEWHTRRCGSAGLLVRRALLDSHKLVPTARSSAVSLAAALLSQCLKYSSTAACLASLPLANMAAMPPLAWADLPCMALLKLASRLWSSRSRVEAVDEATMLNVWGGFVEVFGKGKIVDGSKRQERDGM